MGTRWLLGIAIGANSISSADLIARPSEPAEFTTKYYVLYTDVERDAAREACLRLDRMAEEYHARTRGFSGQITTKLPVYLYSIAADYLAAGAPPGTGGVFMGDKIMALIPNPASPGAWSVLQHECFHQFARAVIGGDIPVWVNEGMAEYFGAGIFTGDGFVTGFIPEQWRRAIVAMIEVNSQVPFTEMLVVRHEDWNKHLAGEHYLQSWSMIHFLAHADGGRYDARLNGFLRDINLRRVNWQRAWLENFGAADAFEKRWSEYWQKLPANSTRKLEAKAVVVTLTSFLARAAAQGQQFKSAVDFFNAAREGRLKSDAADWLPPSLLINALKVVSSLGEWEAGPGRQLRLTCKDPAGLVITGRFTVQGGRVGEVTIEASP